MDGISEETVRRMVALVRSIAGITKPDGHPNDKGVYPAGLSLAVEAHAISAMLPALPDPDIAEAREIFAQQCEADGCNPDYIEHVRNGAYDETERGIKSTLAAIKRGRLLAGGTTNAG